MNWGETGRMGFGFSDGLFLRLEVVLLWPLH